MAEVVRNVGKGQGTYGRSLRSITPWPTARLGKCVKPMPWGEDQGKPRRHRRRCIEAQDAGRMLQKLSRWDARDVQKVEQRKA
jgi:hypothetical protein